MIIFLKSNTDSTQMLVSICFTCKRLFNGKILAEKLLWGESE